MADTADTAVAPKTAIRGIDHGIVCVHDLEAARARYRSLGFTVTPRGKHIGWSTANYCIMFAQDYIELLGIIDASGYSAGLDELLAGKGEGLLKLALASEDAAAAHEFLAGAGLAPDDVRDLARELEAPGGTVLPEFRLLHPAPEAMPGMSGFICQHLTRELVWRPEWCEHRNTATGIASCAILADDPAALAEGWRRIFGAGAAVLDDGRLCVETGTSRLDFMSREALAREFGGIELALADSGTIAGMTLAVSDLAAAENCLAETGVACIRTGHGLAVPPEDACGVIVAFAETT